MNTPRSKPIVRVGLPRKTTKRNKIPDGSFIGGLHNKEMQVLVASIITYLPQIEERMIDVMALLIGNSRSAPARQIFRAVLNEDARVKIMRALLEHSPLNREKGEEYDEVIDLFVEVKKKRNTYAHGLWRTHSSGRVFIQEASTDALAEFLSEREVKKSELETALQRMTDLWRKILAVSFPEYFGPNRILPPLPETPPAPPPQEN